MTEHVQKCPRGKHSWKIGHDLNFASDRFGERFVYCFFHECNATMTWGEAEARLDEYETLKAATERLNAEDARRARYGYQYQDVDKALTAYADILEGKDE